MASILRGPQPVDGLTFTVWGSVTLSVTYDFKTEVITQDLLPENTVGLFFDPLSPAPDVTFQKSVVINEDQLSSLNLLNNISKRVIHITGSFFLNNDSSEDISAHVFVDASILSWNGNKMVVYKDEGAFLGYTSSVVNGIKKIPGAVNIT